MPHIHVESASSTGQSSSSSISAKVSRLGLDGGLPKGAGPLALRVRTAALLLVILVILVLLRF